MALVAGVDSSTQSCKVVVCDADSGEVVRAGVAPHPAGTEVDPESWWIALNAAAEDAGGLHDVVAISIAAQQHGLICLDDAGEVVRPALLWNDTRSADAASDLVAECGPAWWAQTIGSVPVASFTIAKLRWLADHEPESMARTAGVCLPHDWLSWRLCGHRDLQHLTTDRGDASGSGWWSVDGRHRDDLISLATRGRSLQVPEVVAPDASVGEARRLASGAVVAAGTGDNMAAALGLGAGPGDVIVSIGTSGVVAAVSEVPAHDASGIVAGFADATGRFLPLACTLNAARTIDATAVLLGVDHATFDRIALSAPPGAGGITLLPYLVGERTPNLPDATGTMFGIRLDNFTREHVARAAVEAIICGLRGGLDALEQHGAVARRIILTGGGARSEAVRRITASIFTSDVAIPADVEQVAVGAARQAAWALNGRMPTWSTEIVSRIPADSDEAGVYDRYREVSRPPEFARRSV